jgi:methionine-rich copper-binding protein CopC
MKSKKVLTILLALAIMVTFMPTFAFAAVDANGHDFVEDKANSVEATKCGSWGVKAEKCQEKTNDQTCSAVKYTPVKKACDYQKVKMSVSDFLNAVAAQTPGDAQAIATAVANAKAAYGGYCYLFVDQCKDCGTVKTTAISASDCINHSPSSDVRCKDDVCSVCGAKIAATTAHTKKTPASGSASKFCGDENNTSESFVCEKCGELAETDYAFGELITERYNRTGNQQYGSTPNETTGSIWVNHNWGTAIEAPGTSATQAEKDAFNEKVAENRIVEINGKYYATTVVKEPTCVDAGAAVLVCKDCGLRYDPTPTETSTAKTGEKQVVSYKVAKKHYRRNSYQSQYQPETSYDSVEVRTFENYPADCYLAIPATPTAHKYDHYEYAATCEHKAYSFDLCSANPTHQKNVKETGTATGHSYAVKELKARTCDTDGVVVISCDKCGKEWLALANGAALPSGATENDVKRIGTRKTEVGDMFVGTDKKIYLVTAKSTTGTGDTAYTYLDIPEWRHENHKYGAYEKIADATCIYGAVEATKCSVCGQYDIHHAKQTGKALGHEVKEVVVPATCGSYGYTYKVCTRCDEYLDKDGINITIYRTDYNLVNPVVALDEECKYEWGTLDENTDALICTVCGNVKVGSEVPKTEDAKKAAAVEAAKPVIEAAAEVLSNADVYTADSVKAVQEAKDMLYTAIAGGTVSDVKAMTELLQKATAAVEAKVANTVKASNKTLKASASKTKTFKKAAKAKNAVGKVTFKKANKAGGSKIAVKSNGNVVVKKGLKKGTYNVKFTATAKGDGNTLKGSSSATIKVVVK